MKQASPRKSFGNPLWPLGAVATCVYLAFIGLPLIALTIQAVRSGRLLDSLSTPFVAQALRVSAVTTSIGLVVIVLVGTPLAYLLARRRGTFLRGVDLLVELPIVLPPVVGGVALLMAFGRRGLLGGGLEALGITLPFTTAAVVLAQIFVSAPFYIRAARLGFQGVDRRLEDASQTLGVSPWRTFWRLTLPLAWPSLIGGMALAWARSLSEFGATIMFAGNFTGRTQTLPLAILSAMESDIPAALALSLLAVVAAALVLVALGFAGHWAGRGRA